MFFPLPLDVQIDQDTIQVSVDSQSQHVQVQAASVYCIDCKAQSGLQISYGLYYLVISEDPDLLQDLTQCSYRNIQLVEKIFND